MTRPLTPRLAKPGRSGSGPGPGSGPRPLSPLLALVVLAAGILASAGLGLRTAAAGRDVPVAPVAATSPSVQIANFAFAPQVLTVTAGDSITWTNQDEAPHTVTTTSAPRAISSPMLSKGQSFTFRFTVPGTYSYYCAVHPDMRAQVVVNPAPAAPTTPRSSAKPSSSPPPQPTHSVAVASAPATPSAVHSQHEGAPSAPAASSPASSAASATSAVSAAPASSALSTDAAAAPAAPGGGQSSLNPTLVLAGITAGTTVFCLLLVASRRTDES
jgi:amicyanin